MSEAAAPAQPAAPLGAQPPSAQPTAPPQAAGQPSVHVHLPPDLLRMAGLPQPSAPAQAPAQQALPLAARADEAPAAKADERPAAPPAKPADADALAQVAALRAEIRSTKIRAEVERVAAVAGAIDPAMVHALIAADLDVADDGKVIVKGDARTTGEQHIARYLAGKAFLLKPLVPGGGAGSPSTLQPPGAAPVLDMSSNAGATALARRFAEQRGFLPPRAT